MFKIIGDGISFIPNAIDVNSLAFQTEYEATKVLENSLLNGNFKKVGDKWLLDGDESKWFSIVGKREWSINSFNPCKEESGKIGESIYNFIESTHNKITSFLKGKIECYCCREVNYRSLKYGLILAFIPFIPYIQFIGFFMIVGALALRQVI